MKVYELNQTDGVYYSAPDRIVKKIDEHTYEAYRITVLDNMKTLTINTINFDELEESFIHKKLADCGLIYDKENNRIVQQFDPSRIVEEDSNKIPYLLADRISYSGYVNDAVTYQFSNASELNEILLEHDIPIKFKNSTLEDL